MGRNGGQPARERGGTESLTDTRLAYLSEDVAQPLHTFTHSMRVVHEPVDSLGRFLRVDVERGVVYVREERWTLRR